MKTPDRESALGALGRVLGPPFTPEYLEGSESGRRLVAYGPHGVRVMADAMGSENSQGEREPWVSVRLPGQACRVAGSERVCGLPGGWGELGRVKVSRLDVALDDRDEELSPRRFAETCVGPRLDDENAGLGENVVSRVRRENWNWDRRLGGCFWVGGWGSDRKLRVYDKTKESRGEVVGHRVEFQCRNRFATSIAGKVRDAAELGGVAASHLVAYLDLREPVGTRGQSQRWRRVPWWQEFLKGAERASSPRASTGPSEVWERQVRRQAAGWLSVLSQLEGADRLDVRLGLQEAARALQRGLGGQGTQPLSKVQQARLRELGRAGRLVGCGAAVRTPEPVSRGSISTRSTQLLDLGPGDAEEHRHALSGPSYDVDVSDLEDHGGRVGVGGLSGDSQGTELEAPKGRGGFMQ